MKKFVIQRVSCFLFLLLFVFSVLSKVEERTLELYSETSSADDIIKQAEKQLTNELAMEVLGLEGLDEIQSSIDKKVLPKSKRFILSTKIIKTLTSEDPDFSLPDSSSKNKVPKPQAVQSDSKLSKQSSKDEVIDSQYKFLTSVLVRFSKETLRKILIKENLFYLDKSSNRILALIEFNNEIDDYVYRWWSGDKLEKPVLGMMKSFYNQIQSVFLKHGFYSMNPVFGRHHRRIPKNLQYSSLNKDRAGDLARFFQAQLMIVGSVTLSSLSKRVNQVVWDTALYHSISLRELGAYKVRIKTKKDSYEFLNKESGSWISDFALQASSIYERGALSAHLFKIDVDGLLSFLERETIKKNLITQIKNIKNLTPAVIGSQRIQYRADVEGDDKKVLEDIKNLKILDFKLSPYIKSKNHIVIRVRTS